MDTATGDIRAVEFTSSDKGDSPVLPHLLDQIPPDEQIGTVTGDGAFDTRRCHSAILERGGTAIIPIRKNGRRWREDCPAAKARNEILMADENQGLVALETKVSDLEKKQGDFDALTARLDKLETKPARPDAGEKKDEVTPERKAFAAYLVRGDGISDDDKKALNQSIDLQGGFLAPAELSTEVIRALVEYNPMRSLADVRPTTSPSTIYQTRSDLTNAKWVGETQTREESEITFGQTEIAVKELATFVDISNRLLADAPQAETEVRLAPAEDFGGKEAHGFLWGQGVLEPNGLMVDPAIASTANGHATALSPDALIIFDCGWQ